MMRVIAVALNGEIIDLGAAEQIDLEVRRVCCQGAIILDREHDRAVVP